MANRIEYTLLVNDAGKVKVEGITKSFVKLETAINQVSTNLKKQRDEFTKLNTTLPNTVSNAGLAGATLTELGRTISDLPFGIRGVANNLSQLSSATCGMGQERVRRHWHGRDALWRETTTTATASATATAIARDRGD